jgi:hypothetical protein
MKGPWKNWWYLFPVGLVAEWVIESVVEQLGLSAETEVHALVLFSDRRLSPEQYEQYTIALDAEISRGHAVQEAYETQQAVYKQMTRWEAMQTELE